MFLLIGIFVLVFCFAVGSLAIMLLLPTLMAMVWAECRDRRSKQAKEESTVCKLEAGELG